jgi:molecular chaperone DnaJ
VPTQRDLYEILGVARNASDDDIKKAYRSLARKHHPDVVRDGKKADAEIQFKEINAAYSVLSDAGKRAHYDRFGTIPGAQGGGPGSGPGFGGEGIGDIFDLFFGVASGGGRRRAGPPRGADLRYDIEITYEDVLAGHQRQIKFTRLDRCAVCRGSGAADGAGPVQCPNCDGHGEVRAVRQTPLGQFMTTSTCPRCGGTGGVIINPCKTCRGAGRRESLQQVDVRVPPGVEEGSRIRFTGLGEAGERGGSNGDLYVYINIKPHDIFERVDADLHCDTGISFTQAALGAKLELEALDGAATVDVPAGTQNGTTFRIHGRGLPRARGPGRGDLIVDVYVRVPKKLTRKQRDLLEEFARAGGEDVEDKGFFKRVKEAFGGE